MPGELLTSDVRMLKVDRRLGILEYRLTLRSE
jgi:hypothetical protein